ncbi:MAG: hypothetical protein JXN60_03945 [Lentisphaerae bacterium]|nr:hypothetical protein [Lentisphaerota bacterium]
MTGNELVALLEKNAMPFHLIGSVTDGVIAALSCEGRLFTVMRGEVISRVAVDALVRRNQKGPYIPAGGDALWPAPEGTNLGYQYATGVWRIPPGLACTIYAVTRKSENCAIIETDVDLINADGLGVPTHFRRECAIQRIETGLRIRTVESIVYIGTHSHSRQECLLAPWSLSQFDVSQGCHVVCPAASPKSLWDLYEPSDSLRSEHDGLWRFATEGTTRYQIGLGPDVSWIELHLPDRGLCIRRHAELLPTGLGYTDIADAPPNVKPETRDTRYSIFNGNTGFMEIEAAGGCPAIIEQGSELRMVVTTEFRRVSSITA